MRKIYFFGIVLLLLGLAGWGIYTVFKPHRNVASQQAVANLPAVDLYHDFESDENLANKKWVGKVIEITGTISSVSETGNYISINLRAAENAGVNCSLLKSDVKSEDLPRAGDQITVKGKCTGFLIDVNLVDCIVKK